MQLESAKQWSKDKPPKAKFGTKKASMLKNKHAALMLNKKRGSSNSACAISKIQSSSNLLQRTTSIDDDWSLNESNLNLDTAVKTSREEILRKSEVDLEGGEIQSILKDQGQGRQGSTKQRVRVNELGKLGTIKNLNKLLSQNSFQEVQTPSAPQRPFGLDIFKRQKQMESGSRSSTGQRRQKVTQQYLLSQTLGPDGFRNSKEQVSALLNPQIIERSQERISTQPTLEKVTSKSLRVGRSTSNQESKGHGSQGGGKIDKLIKKNLKKQVQLEKQKKQEMDQLDEQRRRRKFELQMANELTRQIHKQKFQKSFERDERPVVLIQKVKSEKYVKDGSLKKAQVHQQNIAKNGQIELRLHKSHKGIGLNSNDSILMNSSKLLNRKEHSNERGQRVLSGMSKKSGGPSQKSAEQRGRLNMQSAHAGGKKDSIISMNSNTVGPHQGGGANLQSSQRLDGLNNQFVRDMNTHEIREQEQSQEDSSIQELPNGLDKQLLNESTSFRKFLKKQNKTSRYSEDFEFENLKEQLQKINGKETVSKLIQDESIQNLHLKNGSRNNLKFQPNNFHNQTFSHGQKILRNKVNLPKSTTQRKKCGMDFLSVKKEIQQELRQVDKRVIEDYKRKRSLSGKRDSTSPREKYHRAMHMLRSKSSSPIIRNIESKKKKQGKIKMKNSEDLQQQPLIHSHTLHQLRELLVNQKRLGLNQSISYDDKLKQDVQVFMKKKQQQIRLQNEQSKLDQLNNIVKIHENLQKLDKFVRNKTRKSKSNSRSNSKSRSASIKNRNRKQKLIKAQSSSQILSQTQVIKPSKKQKFKRPKSGMNQTSSGMLSFQMPRRTNEELRNNSQDQMVKRSLQTIDDRSNRKKKTVFKKRGPPLAPNPVDEIKQKTQHLLKICGKSNVRHNNYMSPSKKSSKSGSKFSQSKNSQSRSVSKSKSRSRSSKQKRVNLRNRATKAQVEEILKKIYVPKKPGQPVRVKRQQTQFSFQDSVTTAEMEKKKDQTPTPQRKVVSDDPMKKFPKLQLDKIKENNFVNPLGQFSNGVKSLAESYRSITSSKKIPTTNEKQEQNYQPLSVITSQMDMNVQFQGQGYNMNMIAKPSESSIGRLIEVHGIEISQGTDNQTNVPKMNIPEQIIQEQKESIPGSYMSLNSRRLSQMFAKDTPNDLELEEMAKVAQTHDNRKSALLEDQILNLPYDQEEIQHTIQIKDSIEEDIKQTSQAHIDSQINIQGAIETVKQGKDLIPNAEFQSPREQIENTSSIFDQVNNSKIDSNPSKSQKTENLLRYLDDKVKSSLQTSKLQTTDKKQNKIESYCITDQPNSERIDDTNKFSMDSPNNPRIDDQSPESYVESIQKPQNQSEPDSTERISVEVEDEEQKQNFIIDHEKLQNNKDSSKENSDNLNLIPIHNLNPAISRTSTEGEPSPNQNLGMYLNQEISASVSPNPFPIAAVAAQDQLSEDRAVVRNMQNEMNINSDLTTLNMEQESSSDGPYHQEKIVTTENQLLVRDEQEEHDIAQQQALEDHKFIQKFRKRQKKLQDEMQAEVIDDDINQQQPVEVAQIEIEIQENTSQFSNDKEEPQPDRLSSRSEVAQVGLYFDNEVNKLMNKMQQSSKVSPLSMSDSDEAEKAISNADPDQNIKLSDLIEKNVTRSKKKYSNNVKMYDKMVNRTEKEKLVGLCQEIVLEMVNNVTVEPKKRVINSQMKEFEVLQVKKDSSDESNPVEAKPKSKTIQPDQVLDYLKDEVRPAELKHQIKQVMEIRQRHSVESDLLRSDEYVNELLQYLLQFEHLEDHEDYNRLLQQQFGGVNYLSVFLRNLTQPIKKPLLDELRKMQTQDLGQYMHFESCVDPLKFPILPIDMYIDVEKQRTFLEPDPAAKDLKKNYASANSAFSEISALSGSASIGHEAIHILNKGIFDSMNESLTKFRPYGMSGQPLPWSNRYRRLQTEVDINSVDTERLFQMVKQEVYRWMSSQQGALANSEEEIFSMIELQIPLMPDIQDRIKMQDDKSLSNLERLQLQTPTELVNMQEQQLSKYKNQLIEECTQELRQTRLTNLLHQQIIEDEHQWLNYEFEESQIKIDLSETILEQLVQETVEFLNKKS